MFRRDRPVDRRGGGVLLYVDGGLLATEYQPKTKYPEHVWCKIVSKNEKEVLIGVCYRTPNLKIFDNDNSELLRELLNEVQEKQLILMGDMNYGDIIWSSMESSSKQSGQFVECSNDCFM